MMLLIPALVGANTIICRYLNAMYAKHNTQGMGTLTNYITGLAASLVALLALGEPAAFQPIGPLTFRTVFMFLGGALGVLLIQLMIYITPRMPAFLSTILIFISQLGTGLVLDYLLTHSFSLGKIAGGVLVLAGLWHYAYVNRCIAARCPAPSATQAAQESSINP